MEAVYGYNIMLLQIAAAKSTLLFSREGGWGMSWC